MPRGPRDHWDDEEAARRYDDLARSDAYRDPGRRADYRGDDHLTPEERELIGGPNDGPRGSYAPTAEEAIGRERRSWIARARPEPWFHRGQEGPHRGRGPKGYTRSGERIREDVSDWLTDDPHLDASDIEVAVEGTEVTLSGTVDSRAAKRRAEDLADDVIGVTHVQNNLRVRPRPGTVGATTDPRIAAVSDGKDAGEAAHDLAEERANRAAHPPR